MSRGEPDGGDGARAVVGILAFLWIASGIVAAGLVFLSVEPGRAVIVGTGAVVAVAVTAGIALRALGGVQRGP